MNKALLLVLPAVLWLSCSTDTVGATCTIDADCQSGQTCFLSNGFMDGFCSRGCTAPGSTNECPGTSICTETSDGLVRFCSLECAGGGCRTGYQCVAVPQATVSACTP